MNETKDKKTWLNWRRAGWIWLTFFGIFTAVYVVADIDATIHATYKPPYWLQVLVVAGIATLMMAPFGLWMFVRWAFAGWHNVRRTLVGFAIIATLIAVFYAEEDWRGKRAWENCKRELEAKGAVLDWNKYIPPAIPDDQNFYTASTNITLRFVKARTEAQGEAASRLEWLRLGPMGSNNLVAIADVTVIASNAVPGDADLYLRYDHSVLTVGTSQEDFSELQSPILPFFDLKDVPLKNAIEQAAQAAKLKYTIDSKVKSVDSKGDPIRITIGWKNITARQALLALLDNFDLVLVEDSKTGIAWILPKQRQVYAEPSVTKEINRVLSPVLDPDTNGFQGASLKGALGFLFFAKSPSSVKPTHIILWADVMPSVQEMSDIFSKNTAKSTGTNSFRIYGNPKALSADDYLAWSDQYEPAFDEIRQALKRPYAIIPGDYSTPYLIPIPNFVTMRAVAQTLAQRAQCDLLLGRPEQALREVTLIHDICRILEKPPTGKPETLVEAMINVAIEGLYTSTVEDGFSLKAWREPQIVVLQQQFKETKLLPPVFGAFQAEQAASACTLQNTPASKIGELFNMVNVISEKEKPSIWRRFWNEITSPVYLFFKLAPRGWIYQNMVTGVKGIHFRDGINLEQETISPEIFDKSMSDLNKSIQHVTPFNVWARIGIPNYLKAWQTTAHKQTFVNEGQIVCALERYHLAHGNYPETLDALVPQFIEKLPHDIIGGEPLHYRRMEDGKFLLYSVGWNETDDDGTPGVLAEPNKGDWVWKN